VNSLLIPVSRGLFAAYAVIALAALLPIQLQDPNWQLRVISNLLNNAPLPLVGIGLLLLAQDREPAANQQTLLLQRRLVRQRWLCVLAAMGFAVLALLQVRVSLKFLQQSDALHLSQNQQLQQQFTAIRTGLAAASEPQQLERAAAVLMPPEQRPALRDLPIPTQRRQLLQQLTGNDLKARRDLDRQRSQRQAALVVDGLRNLLLAVVFAFSFWAIKPRLPFLTWLRAAPPES